MQLAGVVKDCECPAAKLRCGSLQPMFLSLDDAKHPKWRPVALSSAGITISGGFGGGSAYHTESLEYVCEGMRWTFICLNKGRDWFTNCIGGSQSRKNEMRYIKVLNEVRRKASEAVGEN